MLGILNFLIVGTLPVMDSLTTASASLI